MLSSAFRVQGQAWNTKIKHNKKMIKSIFLSETALLVIRSVRVTRNYLQEFVAWLSYQGFIHQCMNFNIIKKYVVALTWLSLTLHYRKRKFYYQKYVNIQAWFSTFCIWISYLLLYLPPITVVLGSRILSKLCCIYLISTKKRFTLYPR